jgi:hypothetical protein
MPLLQAIGGNLCTKNAKSRAHSTAQSAPLYEKREERQETGKNQNTAQQTRLRPPIHVISLLSITPTRPSRRSMAARIPSGVRKTSKT